MQFTINGGIKTFDDINTHLNYGVAGCMLGRQAYDNPWMFRHVDSTFYSKPDANNSRKDILLHYAEWATQEQNSAKRLLNNGVLSKPLCNLWKEEQGASAYRRRLNEVMRTKEYAGNFEASI